MIHNHENSEWFTKWILVTCDCTFTAIFFEWPFNLVKITFTYFDENYLDESKSEGPGLKPMDAWAVKLYFSLTPNLFSEKHTAIVKSFIIKKIMDKQIT